jgi:hypothetical protein
MPSAVGNTAFSMKNEMLHLITGFNIIQNILTDQSVLSHTHCREKRELSAQTQVGAGNCRHTEVSSSQPFPPPPLAYSWTPEWLTLLSLSLSSLPLPHTRILSCSFLACTGSKI